MKPDFLKFIPVLKPTLWGGNRIARFKNLNSAPDFIGESWEVSAVPGSESVVANGACKGQTLSQLTEKFPDSILGPRGIQKARLADGFPLLVKLIDAHKDLSYQVHPADDLAMKRHGLHGKNEMWYILSTTPEARIHTGFRHPLTRQDFLSAVRENRVPEEVNSFHARPGDVFFLPAGRVHSIGAGNFLVEVQQTSDITYRIYDYDRRDHNGEPRRLHIEDAADAIDYSNTESCASLTPSSTLTDDHTLINCDFFRVERRTVSSDAADWSHDGASFIIATVLDGSAHFTSSTSDSSAVASTGETILIPAHLTDLRVSGPATLLKITV